MKETQKLEKEAQEMFGLLRLIYFKLSGLTPIIDFNIENAAAIYGIDKIIVELLLRRGVIKKGLDDNDKMGYKWDTIDPNIKMAEALLRELR